MTVQDVSVLQALQLHEAPGDTQGKQKRFKPDDTALENGHIELSDNVDVIK